jgi:F-type H+-transporting ATPase subunit delta
MNHGPLDPASATYARTFFELAVEDGRAEQVAEEIDGVSAVIAADPETRLFLESTRIRPEVKYGVIDRAFTGRVSDPVRNGLKVLVRRDRFYLFDEIRTAYHRRLDEHLRRVRALLITAVPATESDLEAVKAAVREKIAKEAVIETRVDPALLGGFVLQVEGSVIDASVAQRLRSLRNRLMTAGQADIQARADKLLAVSY